MDPQPVAEPETIESPPRRVVGWRERVRLPDWGVDRLMAKIDTGARTSSIHVAELEERGDGTARFEVVVRERPERRTVWVEAEVVRRTVVKPSSGDRQERPVVRTRLAMGGKVFPIEVTLVCRKGMLCRMLVGRTALAGRFLVDPEIKHVHRKKVTAHTRAPEPPTDGASP
ncbi:MAG: RimK/LysX family protein [Planctomycetota bacterium]